MHAWAVRGYHSEFLLYQVKQGLPLCAIRSKLNLAAAGE